MLFAFAAALLLLASASAATYYVDYAQGSNSNAGTSPGAPWKHVPGDSDATGTPASTSLNPGDTVLFRGGVRYVGGISLLWSGTSDQPIIYDGKSWNGQRAILSTNFADRAAITAGGASRAHLKIRGFRIAEVGGYSGIDPIWQTTDPVSAPPGGTGISLSGGSQYVEVSDCEFAEIGQWRNTKPMSGTTSVTGTGVALENNAHILITDCDFTRMKTGVSVKATTEASNITIQRSSFHNYMNWLIDIAPRKAGAAFRNITIDQCRLYDYKEFDLPNWQGYGEKPHQDGIFLRTSGMASTWENVVIRNSVFYSDQSSQGGTASIYISQGPSVDIYNCAFLNDHHTNSHINVGYNKISGMSQTVRIWNNTFAGSTRAIKVSPGNSNPDRVEILNNAFYRSAPYDVLTISDSGIGTLLMDNNVYYGAHSGRAVYDGSGYRTLEQWQSQSGKDRNSKWADPLFTTVSGPASGWNARPASDVSPLVAMGADLSGFFSTCADGTTRTGGWDVGAFEYTGSAPQSPPNPPASLRISAN